MDRGDGDRHMPGDLERRVTQSLAMPLVEIRELRFTYPDGTRALAGVDFSLAPGESVALLGANGSGKTTLALHLNGLMQEEGNSEGSVAIEGLPVAHPNLQAIRAKVGIVFQDADTQLFMPSVLEDVMFGLRNQGLDAEQAQGRAMEALQWVEMEHAAARAPYHLSAGEKRRVALAGVLAMEPKVLVLDEPTTFLDPPAERHLVALLNALKQAKIIITHNVRFARAVTSRAVFLQDGTVAGEGTVDEVVARFDWSP